MKTETDTNRYIVHIRRSVVNISYHIQDNFSFSYDIKGRKLVKLTFVENVNFGKH